jgi:hypothetical protein
MKKFAVTAAILALGLAACTKDEGANNTAETNVENSAATDVNAAGNDATVNADAALNAADNAVDNASDAVENASDAVKNSADNAH